MPTPAPPDGVLRVPGRIAAGDVHVLCARVRELLRRTEAELVLCDVAALERPGAEAIDALARLQLAARRCGGRVRLRGARTDLLDLLAFAGLSAVFECEGRSAVELRGEAEQREPPRGVQEEADPGDPSA